jgi:hypothetical protein
MSQKQRRRRPVKTAAAILLPLAMTGGVGSVGLSNHQLFAEAVSDATFGVGQFA